MLPDEGDNPVPEPAGVPNPAGGVRCPAVMEFRVQEDCEPATFELPEVLSPPGAKGSGGSPEIWEMTEVEDASGVQFPTDGIIRVTGADGTTRTYRRTASRRWAGTRTW